MFYSTTVTNPLFRYLPERHLDRLNKTPGTEADAPIDALKHCLRGKNCRFLNDGCRVNSEDLLRLRPAEESKRAEIR